LSGSIVIDVREVQVFDVDDLLAQKGLDVDDVGKPAGGAAAAPHRVYERFRLGFESDLAFVLRKR
jgi:hypothetical protein